MSLKLSNNNSCMGDLIFATLYDYAEPPRKTKGSNENMVHFLRIALGNGYLILSEGGNDFSEILFKVGWGGVK